LDKTSDILLVFKGETVIDKYFGTLTAYQEEQAELTDKVTEKRQIAEKRIQSSLASKEKKEKTKLTFKEQKEWETIEDELYELEEKVSSVEEKMTQSSADYEKLQKLTKERQELKTAFDEKMNRWEYLSQFAE